MWKDGPLPPKTYGWGAITTEKNSVGFFFADFKGDHVTLPDGKDIPAAEIVMYDNSLELPPKRSM